MAPVSKEFLGGRKPDHNRLNKPWPQQAAPSLDLDLQVATQLVLKTIAAIAERSKS